MKAVGVGIEESEVQVFTNFFNPFPSHQHQQMHKQTLSFDGFLWHNFKTADLDEWINTENICLHIAAVNNPRKAQ